MTGRLSLVSDLNLRFLLLQVRDQDDPMIQQEVRCFARALECRLDQIEVCDLLSQRPTDQTLGKVDCVLIGGSGRYSATATGVWLDRTFDLLCELVERAKPTFASCWGFQAMARALGGTVVTDRHRAELGTIGLRLTDAGKQDRLFGTLPAKFFVQLGHEDTVTQLPAEAICLASSTLVDNQAFVIAGKPIYGTQFHPELDLRTLLQRVEAYPEYIRKIHGIGLEEFSARCSESPEASTLIRRFTSQVFGA